MSCLVSYKRRACEGGGMTRRFWIETSKTLCGSPRVVLEVPWVQGKETEEESIISTCFVVNFLRSKLESNCCQGKSCCRLCLSFIQTLSFIDPITQPATERFRYFQHSCRSLGPHTVLVQALSSLFVQSNLSILYPHRHLYAPFPSP